jgi:hypothetical protein
MEDDEVHEDSLEGISDSKKITPKIKYEGWGMLAGTIGLGALMIAGLIGYELLSGGKIKRGYSLDATAGLNNETYQVGFDCQPRTSIDDCLKTGEVVALCNDNEYPPKEPWNVVWGEARCAARPALSVRELTEERKHFGRYIVTQGSRTIEVH